MGKTRAFRDRIGIEGEEPVVASRVVLTPGAWGATLLPKLGLTLPLSAHRQQTLYIGGVSDEFSAEHFPVFLNLDHDFYGFPLDEQGLLKVSIHSPGTLVDPDTKTLPDASYAELLMSLVRTYIPLAAEGEVRMSRVCMYAMTPDEDFIIDRMPGHENVTFAVGFSGHGFKFGPVIGELVASLALGEEPEFSMQPFALSRF